MTDLAEWLRDQLDEDERLAMWARDDADSEWWFDSPDPDSGAEHLTSAWSPARVLAEVAAKRQILELLEDGTSESNWWYEDRISRLLAVPYAGRPGWRDEWRPGW